MTKEDIQQKQIELLINRTERLEIALSELKKRQDNILLVTSVIVDTQKLLGENIYELRKQIVEKDKTINNLSKSNNEDKDTLFQNIEDITHRLDLHSRWIDDQFTRLAKLEGKEND